MTNAGTIWDQARGGTIELYEYRDGGQDYTHLHLDGILAEKHEPDAAPGDEPEPDRMETAPLPLPGPQLEEMRAEYEHRMAEETRRAFEAGRQQGQKAAEETYTGVLAKLVEERRRQAEQLLAGFQSERDSYLVQVEQEVVRLSLQVAARILRRESQMDPLLLTGAVRVALGQLASSTTMKLRVPAADYELWREAIAHLPKLQIRPEIVGDPGMRLGECIIETGLGSVDLGIRAQLAEIERGFFDRAPGARPEGAGVGKDDPDVPHGGGAR